MSPAETILRSIHKRTQPFGDFWLLTEPQGIRWDIELYSNMHIGLIRWFPTVESALLDADAQLRKWHI